MLCIHSGQLRLKQAYFISHFLCIAFLIDRLFWGGFSPKNAEDAEVTDS